MGYACPVCDDPQADAEHLANHLAFTAMLRGAGHEAWLDDHVDGWADRSPEELAEQVSEYADEEEFPQSVEDATGGHESGHGDAHGGHDHGAGGHDHGGQSADGVESAAPGGIADFDVDDDQEDVLAEARELTRRRRENAAADSEPEGEADASDGDEDEDEETGSS
ncbi:DUF5810 domain-containing protein [Halosimplex aquaticum]|uniref:DUF5810 domain-containing protein n=1 Tax=Halosimplex aquaticum TaxID=3026162 RepID=A0ABD5Y1V1_9EURY|nr:DUF5810 domain-containing protein [Halosimplex aquaticum]